MGKLNEDAQLQSNEKAKEALEEMNTLFEYMDILEITDNFQFDLSLARGLDYYTGLIYEAVLTDSDRVGSIAGGGRYDTLLGMFSNKSIPAVGVSIGIERIFNILEEKMKDDASIRQCDTEVLVAAVGKGMTKERMNILNELWKNKIKAEMLYSENPRGDKQMDFVMDNRIPFVINIGENEAKEGKVKIKCIANRAEIIVERENMIEELNKLRADKSLYDIKVEDKKKK